MNSPRKRNGAEGESAPQHDQDCFAGDLFNATDTEQFSVNGVAAPVYPVDSIEARLLEAFACDGMTERLACRIAARGEAALFLLGERSYSAPKAPDVSLHQMLLHVLDSIAEVASRKDGLPGAQQLAEACYAYAVVWRRPWLCGIKPGQIASRCGISRQAFAKRLQRVRARYGIPQAKGDEQRAKLRAGRRRWLERPRPVVVTQIERPEVKEAA